MVGAAAVGTIGAIGSGIIGANAAKSGASAQRAAANQATQTQQNQLAQTRQDIATQQGANTGYLNPYMQTGSNANGELGYLLGLGGTDSSGGTLGNAGSLGQSFTMADYQADPGYAFRLQQGQQALDRAASAGGKYFSGQAIKSLSDYNQNAASNEYQNAYNRYTQNQNNLYNKLGGLSSAGQQASTNLGQINSNLTSGQATAGTNAANQIGQNYIGIGNATSAADTAVGNAYGNTIGALTGNNAGYQQGTQSGLNPITNFNGGTGGMYSSPQALPAGAVDLGSSMPWLQNT